MEPYGGLLGSRQNCTGFHANGIPRWSALEHWGLTRGDEGHRLTGGDGEPEYVTQPNLEWPKRVSAGWRKLPRVSKLLPRVSKLCLQECVVGTALFKMGNQQRVTLWHRELIIWQPGWEGYFGDQDTWVHMVESIYCPPETQNIINLLYPNKK